MTGALFAVLACNPAFSSSPFPRGPYLSDAGILSLLCNCRAWRHIPMSENSPSWPRPAQLRGNIASACLFFHPPVLPASSPPESLRIPDHCRSSAAAPWRSGCSRVPAGPCPPNSVLRPSMGTCGYTPRALTRHRWSGGRTPAAGRFPIPVYGCAASPPAAAVLPISYNAAFSSLLRTPSLCV